jgi:type IV pilus assembly protein PilY1
VSNPDSPAFLWKIDENTAGFGELGQSWSVPVVTYVPGYASGGVPKPVLIFGAGYDTAKDSKATVATADSEAAASTSWMLSAARWCGASRRRTTR